MSSSSLKLSHGQDLSPRFGFCLIPIYLCPTCGIHFVDYARGMVREDAAMKAIYGMQQDRENCKYEVQSRVKASINAQLIAQRGRLCSRHKG